MSNLKYYVFSISIAVLYGGVLYNLGVTPGFFFGVGIGAAGAATTLILDHYKII